MRGTHGTFFLLCLATSASAEVMDKELAIPDLWLATAVSVALAIGAAFLHRWLLPLSFLAAMLLGPSFAWTEWHDPHVGPAIAQEAGASYGLYANGAFAVIIVVHMLSWGIAVSRLRKREQARDSWSPPVVQRLARERALFLATILALTILAAVSGFATGPSIWTSAPIAASSVGLLWAVALALKA
jgi:hypothetical protein